MPDLHHFNYSIKDSLVNVIKFLVTFTEEILNGKLHFFWSVYHLLNNYNGSLLKYSPRLTLKYCNTFSIYDPEISHTSHTS